MFFTSQAAVMERATPLESNWSQVQMLSRDLPAQVLQRAKQGQTAALALHTWVLTPLQIDPYSAAAGRLLTQSSRVLAIPQSLWDIWN